MICASLAVEGPSGGGRVGVEQGRGLDEGDLKFSRPLAYLTFILHDNWLHCSLWRSFRVTGTDFPLLRMSARVSICSEWKQTSTRNAAFRTMSMAISDMSDLDQQCSHHLSLHRRMTISSESVIVRTCSHHHGQE